MCDYLLMKNRRHRINLLISFFLTITAVTPASADLDFFRLFLKNQVAQPLPMYSLLAHYSSDDGSLFLGMHKQNKTYELFELGTDIRIGSLSAKVSAFDDGKLMFESDDGQTYFLSFADRGGAKNETLKKLGETVAQSSSPTNTFLKNDNLFEFKEIANAIGVPKFITSQFTSLPGEGRTNSGRRGWILDESVPNILLLASPFRRNDIIVTIDGKDTTNIEKLRRHLKNKSMVDYFDVEIQRDGQLKMIRVRL